jgi:hypothetical protein
MNKINTKKDKRNKDKKEKILAEKDIKIINAGNVENMVIFVIGVQNFIEIFISFIFILK